MRAAFKKAGILFGAVVAIATVNSAVASEVDPVLATVGSGIVNFHAVEPGLIYRGALPEDGGIKLLSEVGIKSIIDLQGGDVVMGIPMADGESKEDIQNERQNAAAATSYG